VLSPVGDHMLYLTRFRTHKIVRLPQTKNEGRGGLKQINTCRKVLLQVNFFSDEILHCFLSVSSFYDCSSVSELTLHLDFFFFIFHLTYESKQTKELRV
jgi:hypothetical protein